MKIKNEFFVTGFIFAIILIIATVSVILTNRRARFFDNQQDVARSIVRGASDLNYLFNDYILYRQDLQRERWESRFSLFSKELSTFRPQSPEQEAVLNNIEDSSRRLKETFSSVVSAIENVAAEGRNPDSLHAFIQIASSRVAVQSQGMVFDALRLSQMLGNQSDRLDLLNLLLLSLLLVIFCAYFLVNYLIVYRRAWRSLATLRAGTRAVGSGNLDFRVKRERDDEIGEVVDAFNLMTTDLKTVTASKADLEKEIRERKRLEVELREANTGLEERVEERTQKIAIERQRLYDVLETLPAMICLLTPDYQISFANRSFREMFGEPNGRPCYEYCFGFDKRCDFCEAYKVLKTGEPHHWEITTPDGSVIDAYDFPFTDADGSRMILEMGIDITGRKRAEAELERHQEHLEELVRERTAEVQLASEAYKESRRAALNIMEDAVSARRQAEESAAELHHSVMRFELLATTARELLKSTEQGIVESICLKVMKHLDCNTFFNFLVDEQVGKMHLNAWTGITPEEAKQIEWLDQGAAICGWVARDGTPVIAEHLSTTAAPRAELVKSSGMKACVCHPLLGPGERIIGTLSFGTKNRETFSEDELALTKAVADMVATAINRIQAEQAVRESEARYQNLSRSLEETVKQKTAELLQAEHLAAIGQMVSIVAHEIRNPIQVVRTGVDSLRAVSKDAEESGEILEEIEYGARMMEETVSDLLQYARPLKLEFAYVTARDVVEGALRLAADKLRNVSVDVELEQSDEKMHVDSTKFTQVLANVISNAADAMPEGGVLSIRSRLLEGERKRLEFVVMDTGEGIDEEHLGEVFKPFYTTKTRGTGLGLSLSKKIMDAHGGTISITSKLGMGTTVVLRVPLSQVIKPRT